MMQLLVTGGAGFIGSHLVDALVSHGHKVTVIDNLKRGSLANLAGHLESSQIRFFEADIRDYESLQPLFEGTEVVYHLAAQSNVMGAMDDPDYSAATNVLGTQNVLRAASAACTRRVVFASSREVYRDPSHLPVPETAPFAPKNPYGASKVGGEAYCQVWQRVHDLEVQILRFGNIYGTRDFGRVIPIWLENAGRGEDLVLYGGQQTLDFLWIGFAVRALVAAAFCPLAGPINVASGEGISLRELAERILSVTGSSSRLVFAEERKVEVGGYRARYQSNEIHTWHRATRRFSIAFGAPAASRFVRAFLGV